MRSFGIFLIVMALGSAVLPYLGMQFIVVAWIDLWGQTIGWIIRGAMLVAGFGLVALSSRTAAPIDPVIEPPRPPRA